MRRVDAQAVWPSPLLSWNLGAAPQPSSALESRQSVARRLRASGTAVCDLPQCFEQSRTARAQAGARVDRCDAPEKRPSKFLGTRPPAHRDLRSGVAESSLTSVQYRPTGCGKHRGRHLVRGPSTRLVFDFVLARSCRFFWSRMLTAGGISAHQMV